MQNLEPFDARMHAELLTPFAPAPESPVDSHRQLRSLDRSELEATEARQDQLENAREIHHLSVELAKKGTPARIVQLHGQFPHGSMDIKEKTVGDEDGDTASWYTQFKFSFNTDPSSSEEHEIYVNSDGDITAQNDEAIQSFYEFIYQFDDEALQKSPAEIEMMIGLREIFSPKMAQARSVAESQHGLHNAVHAFMDQAENKRILHGAVYKAHNPNNDYLHIEHYDLIKTLWSKNDEESDNDSVGARVDTAQPVLYVRLSEPEDDGYNVTTKSYGVTVDEDGSISTGPTRKDTDSPAETRLLLNRVSTVSAIEQANNDTNHSLFFSDEAIYETFNPMIETLQNVGFTTIQERATLIELGEDGDEESCIVITERRQEDERLDYEVLWMIDELPYAAFTINPEGVMNFLPVTVVQTSKEEVQELHNHTAFDATDDLHNTLADIFTNHNEADTTNLPDMLALALTMRNTSRFMLSEYATEYNGEPALLRVRSALSAAEFFEDNPDATVQDSMDICYKPVMQLGFFEQGNGATTHDQYISIIADTDPDHHGQVSFIAISEDEGPLYYDSALLYRNEVGSNPWHFTPLTEHIDAANAALQHMVKASIVQHSQGIGDAAEAFLKGLGEDEEGLQ